MIQETNSTEQANNIFQKTFSTLKLSKLLRQAGIRKSKGIPAMEVFKFLVLLVFQGKNLYRFLDAFRSKAEFSKNSVYRMLNGVKYNWRRFIHSLSARVIGFISPLTGPDRVKVLIIDDTVVPRNRSKKVELLAKIHDHTSMRFKKGFNMLTIGWSDGYSFVPTDFAMLSSANKTNRYQEINKNIDKRTNGYKRRIESMQRKSDVAVDLIKNSLNQGIEADYVLMDSWFTHGLSSNPA